MFHTLETMLTSSVHVLPLEVFVFIGSVIEEIVAPIPSPAVMLIAGSVSEMQGRGLWALALLAVIGAIGKTAGASVVYMVADKAEDLLMSSCGKFFKLSKDDVEKLGSKLGNGMRDYVVMTFLRAMPVMPSIVISAGSGLLKLPLRLFLISTFLGTIIRDGFYLYAGYAGATFLMSLVEQSSAIEKGVQIGIAIAAVLGIGFWLYKKRTR